jgi:predicted secreted protein with PEFG-CTERM motif
MKSKLFGALSLFALVAILGVAPAFGQYGNPPDQSTGNAIGEVMTYNATASDGTDVIVKASHPISGQPLTLEITFQDANGNFVKHQNYAITVTQDNNTVLSNPTGHTHTGTDTQTTQSLSSADNINIQITLNGVGLPTADPSTWTGVKGEVLSFSQVAPATTTAPADNATVPEFGPVASIVLAIAVLSVVVFAAKTRVIPRL